MKVNAPDKIYIDGCSSFACETTNDSIEYIRADVFIKKAARFLEYKLNDRVEIRVSGTLIPSLTDKKTFVEDFKKYMKGE